MKYAIIDNGVVTEPVTIPSSLPDWANGSVTTFLAKCFPNKEGWVEVPDDVQAGWLDDGNGNGNYTDPNEGTTLPARYAELTFGEFQDLCYNNTDGGALGRLAAPSGTLDEQEMAGMDRYGEIVTAVEASATTSTLGKAANERYTGGKISGFVYEKTMSLLVMLVGMTILTSEEFDEIRDSWLARGGQ